MTEYKTVILYYFFKEDLILKVGTYSTSKSQNVYVQAYWIMVRRIFTSLLLV
jgi:hypothetical protein